MEKYSIEGGNTFSCLYFLRYHNKWLKPQLLLSFWFVLIDRLISGKSVVCSSAQLLKLVRKGWEKMLLKYDKSKEQETEIE